MEITASDLNKLPNIDTVKGLAMEMLLALINGNIEEFDKIYENPSDSQLEEMQIGSTFFLEYSKEISQIEVDLDSFYNVDAIDLSQIKNREAKANRANLN